MHRVIRLTAAVCTTCVLAAARVVSQDVSRAPSEPNPSFKASTDIVRVYATVRDEAGHLVTDLAPDEFELRDRGRRTALAVFSKDAQPITVAVLVDMTGRVFARQTFEYLRDGLIAFVEQFTPQDRARIGWFSEKEIYLSSELTADVSELKKVVLGEIRIERPHPRFSGVRGVTYGSLTSQIGRPLWNAIGAAMQSLAEAPGRKVVLVLTNGPNTSSLGGYPKLEDVRDRMAADEYMLYGVYGFETRYVGRRVVMTRDEVWAFENAARALRELTELGGGGLVSAPSEARRYGRAALPAFVSMLAGLVEELRHQYTLGFVPTRRDGKVGKIDLRVTRPDMKVWARKTYLAPKD
jgi:VWFA-related protein